jgi:hypothetical protein
MNDDQMDEMLIQGVADYNAPRGSVPRDEMWRRIQQARAETRRASAAVVPIEPARRRWLLPSAGVAAAAILAVGVAIGRYMGRESSPGTPAAIPAVASATPTTRPDSTIATSTPAKDSADSGMVRQLHEETRKTDQRVRALASAEQTQRTGTDGRSSANATTPSIPGRRSTVAEGTDGQSLAYRLVVLQHLAGSEAMITSFRSEARGGQLDAELASWSRELLSTTRLLESSQAGTDPVMKRLLDDLDLVISQIVQYTSKGTTDTEELDLIEQSINKRGVMSKLRSTIPSRNFPAGS